MFRLKTISYGRIAGNQYDLSDTWRESTRRCVDARQRPRSTAFQRTVRASPDAAGARRPSHERPRGWSDDGQSVNNVYTQHTDPCEMIACLWIVCLSSAWNLTRNPRLCVCVWRFFSMHHVTKKNGKFDLSPNSETANWLMAELQYLNITVIQTSELDYINACSLRKYSTTSVLQNSFPAKLKILQSLRNSSLGTPWDWHRIQQTTKLNVGWKCHVKQIPSLSDSQKIRYRFGLTVVWSCVSYSVIVSMKFINWNSSVVAILIIIVIFILNGVSAGNLCQCIGWRYCFRSRFCLCRDLK